MTVVQPMIEPDRDAIRAHLDALFAVAQTDYPGGLVELRYGPPDHLDNWAYFNIQERGLSEATEFAAGRNREGQNVYVGVNPRRPNTSTKKAGSAADVEIAFYQFSDIDKAESVVGLVERYSALPPTMTVTTGTVPNKRPHLYWRLEEPVMNMSEWTERQRGLAQTLGGDSVIDPPRIMRLGGTVNYPTQKKMGKGYKVELTAVRTEFPNERCDVTPEQIAQHYPVRVTEIVAPMPQGGTTLSAMSRGTRIADLIFACRSGDQWHNHMVRLVAHLVSIGRTDVEIIGLAAGLTMPGYSVDQTAREMVTAVRGARTKWSVPEPDDFIETEEAAREDPDSTFILLDLDELESLPPPTWLVKEIIAEHGLSIVYGDPGAGKSFIVLDMALRIAFGMDWHGVDTRRVGVLYIAGEGARGLGKRVKGWRREHGLEGADAPFLLLPIAVQLLDSKERAKLCRTIDAAKARAGFDICLVVIDTVSRALAGQDENGQESMSLFVAACGEIQIHTGGAVIGVHHSGKDSSRGMRGSTVLLGGCDASLKVSKDEGQRVTIECEKQKDAEQAEPIYMMLKKIEWAMGLDEPESTLIPEKSMKPLIIERTLSRRDADKIFDEIDRAWTMRRPWSVTPNSKVKGRYLPEWIAESFDVSQDVAIDFVTSWQKHEYVAMEKYSRDTSAQGLRVLKRLEMDE